MSGTGHVVLDFPGVVGGLPSGKVSGICLNQSRDQSLGISERGGRDRRKVMSPSHDVLSKLFPLQVHHYLLLPLDQVVLSKPGKAIWCIRCGQHGL